MTPHILYNVPTQVLPSCHTWRDGVRCVSRTLTRTQPRTRWVPVVQGKEVVEGQGPPGFTGCKKGNSRLEETGPLGSEMVRWGEGVV